jgi:ParB/RepB/Spo0J family partition protein
MNVTNLPINEIVPGPNDRTTFDPIKLQELAESIKEHGLIQPITVRQLDCGTYQIVAGERRYRAYKLSGQETIPAIIQDLTDEEASAIMLSENVSRSDLDPIDEAIAYATRINAFGWTIENCAERAGVSSIRVRFRIKLLKLRSDIQDLVRSGNLEIGYAQIISDCTLDANFQMLAIRSLRDNPSPTTGWFRRICNDLRGKQAQAVMFSDPLFSGCPVVVQDPRPSKEPPHPSTHTPPANGNNAKEIVQSQIGFWESAADSWNEIGKPFKKQECQAAAKALQLAIQYV